MKKITCLIMIISLFMLVSSCGKTKEKIVEVPVYTEVPVEADDHLTISDVSWKCEEWLDSWSLSVTGKAQNTGSCELRFIEVSARGYDSGDNIVATGSNYISGGGMYWTLIPDQSSTWSVHVYGVPQVTKVTVGYRYEADVYVEPLSVEGLFRWVE